MISENQIKQQKNAIKELKELVLKAEDSEKKESALAYCNGCIDACELALEQLNAKKEADAPAVEEEKPKAKRSTKKKAAPEPVEVPTPEPVEELATESADDVDLDDLL